MEASELRIGNFIIGTYENEDDNLVHETVCEFKFYNCYDNYYWVESEDLIEEFTGFKPIPITEEWLLKLPNKLIYPEWIKYLHELQNWYYWNNEKKELHINL